MSDSPKHDDLDSFLIRYGEETGKGAGRGDEAFARAAEKLSGRLFAWAYEVLRDYHLAQNAVQVTLLRLAKAVRDGTWQPGWGTWQFVKTIVVRAAIDELRKRRRERVGAEPFDEAPGRGPPPPEEFERDHLVGLVAEWLAHHATDEERRLLVGWYDEGETLKTIGDSLGYSPTTAMRRRDRALQSLREFLEGS